MQLRAIMLGVIDMGAKLAFLCAIIKKIFFVSVSNLTVILMHIWISIFKILFKVLDLHLTYNTPLGCDQIAL